MLKLLIWRFLFVGFLFSPFFPGCAGMPKYPVNWFLLDIVFGEHTIFGLEAFCKITAAGESPPAQPLLSCNQEDYGLCGAVNHFQE